LLLFAAELTVWYAAGCGSQEDGGEGAFSGLGQSTHLADACMGQFTEI
jgi:hypothetical protein